MTHFGAPPRDQTRPPGWYPDPWNHRAQRWWDGAQWSETYRNPPAPKALPSTGTGVVQVLVALLAIGAVFVVIVVIAGATSPKSDDAEAKRATTAATSPVLTTMPTTTSAPTAAELPIETAPPAPPPTKAPPPPRPVVDGTKTFSGKGEGNTSPVDFSGGHYSVSYDFKGDCFHGAFLKPTSGALAGSHSLPSGMGALHGTDNVYGVEPGTYYVEMISGSPPDCPWQIVLTGAP